MTKISNVLGTLDFSEEEISDRTQIPIERVRDIKAGAPVNQSELRSLSRGLKIPLKTFAAGASRSSRNDELSVLFRDARIEKSAGYEGTIENVGAFIEAALSVLPRRNADPEWLGAYLLREENYVEANRLANLFRNEFYPDELFDPINDLPQVLCNKAGVVTARLWGSRYEGASVVAGGYCFVFVSPRFAGRMLFTLAHELGHLIAHHATGTRAVFDKPTQIGGNRNKGKSEAFADAFASNLLLPDQGVGITLAEIREHYRIATDEVGDVEILVLARMYGVSFEVAARRCEDLELLPRGGARSLYEHVVEAHGSPEKRAEELGLPPRNLPYFPRISENLMAAIIEKVDSGEVSLGQMTDAFGISIEEIYSRHARAADDSAFHH